MEFEVRGGCGLIARVDYEGNIEGFYIEKDSMTYIKFVDKGKSASGLTSIWSVETLEDVELGQIKWFAAWRKYVFWPHSGTLYDSACLKEIMLFIDAEMGKRK
jgi:hypothetical protein